jgi:hypothetical protein
MDLPTSVSISVGTITFGAVALGIVRTFRNNKHNVGNPGNKNSVSSKECEAHRSGFDKQVKLTEESLSREISLTRDVLIREIGEVKDALNRREN